MTNALQLGLFSPRWSAPPPPPAARQGFHDPFRAHHAELLRAAGEERLVFDEAAWNHDSRSAVGIDVEVFRNFFVVCFKRFEDGKRLAFELSERSRLDRAGLQAVLQSNLLISFNGLAYDMPILALALASADNARLKAASDQIVKHDMKPWTVEKELGLRLPRYNHIDLIEPNPSVRQGLKMLHGRLHGRFMVDLPYPEDTWLTREQMNFATLYCFNDLDATEGLYAALREPIELRIALSREYRIDLRSKSDAQIGEAIVKKRAEAALGRRVEKPGPERAGFRYTAPPFIRFEDPRLVAVLERFTATDFYVNAFGKIEAAALKGFSVRIGAATYTLGIGGLHSTEAHRALRSDAEHQLIDCDVASQYPNIIVKLGLYPKALGPAFLDIYGKLIKERLAAKAAGDKVRADGGRIALNGVYGKLGSQYSPLYAPHLLISTTLTGQLSILMLIERAEAAGVPVVSANTDGVLFYCSRNKADELSALLRGWETETGFAVEETSYRAIYNSSVNTYLALREDGKVKRKGWISDPWTEGDLRGQMMKNPQMTVCSEAILRYVKDGAPLEDTIRGCRDPRAFVTVIKVGGGGTWRGHPLGRAVRYYYSTDGAPILDGKRRVAKTEGSRPLLEITNELPPDIDYLRYCEETVHLAEDLGVDLLHARNSVR